jgi:hypothetical protein
MAGVVGAAVIALWSPVVQAWVQDPPPCSEELKNYAEVYDAHPEVIPPVDADVDERCRVTDYLERLNVEGVGEIHVPADGSEVVNPFIARGVATTPKRSLWLLVRPDNNRLYTTFDMPIDVRPDGTWDLPLLRVGQGPEDIGRRYALLLVSAPAIDSEIERRLNGRLPEEFAAVFSELPSDSTELDRITVELVG